MSIQISKRFYYTFYYKDHYINLSALILLYRNRVAVQLQKNLDRIRLKRVAAKMKNATAGGYLISSHPSGLIIGTKNMREATPTSDEEESSRWIQNHCTTCSMKYIHLHSSVHDLGRIFWISRVFFSF